MLTRTISLLILLCNLSCDAGTIKPQADAAIVNFDKAAFLQNIANNVILPTYQSALIKATVLAETLDPLCAAVGSADYESKLSESLIAWRETMQQWQRAELMIFGPLSDNDYNLRDLIYSWPVVNACAVDQDLMMYRETPNTYDISRRLPNRRGLDALEYLLANTLVTSACPPQTRLANWTKLSEEELRLARCEFAKVVTEDVVRQLQTLEDEWLPAKGNFIAELKIPEAGRYGNTTEAINAVFDGIFYLDKKTKDAKLGRILGLTENTCGTSDEPCVKDIESKFADLSIEYIEENIRAFEFVFLGNTVDGEQGLGFDDFLAAMGEEGLSDELKEAITAALNSLESFDTTLKKAIEEDYQTVLTLHQEIVTITTPLKQKVPTVLKLTIPEEAGGDTD